MNGITDFGIELHRLRAENERLKAALDQARISDQCLIDEAVAAATKALQSKVDNLVRVIDEHARVHAENLALMGQMRSQGALMVHALDRALQYNEALFSFWPPDIPMHPNVSTCKQQFDEAIAKVFQRRDTSLRTIA